MPARNIEIQYLLLSFAVKLAKATESKESNTNLCVGQPGKDAHDPTPLTRPATCAKCGLVHDLATLKKGVKQGDVYAVVDQEDIAEAKAEFSLQYKDTANLVPHPAADFYANTAPGEKVNFVIPAGKDCKPGCKGCAVCRYAIMARLVTENPDVAFVSLWTPSSVTALWVLTARDGVLVLEERVRTQDLKANPDIPDPAEFKDKLYGMLEASLEVEPYDPVDYEDKYAAALREMAENAELLVSAKAEAAPVAAKTVQSDDEIMAKMAALAGTKPKKTAAKKTAARKKVA